MTKAEWESAYKEFDKAHSELSSYEHEYKYGSNKKKRNDAGREMDFLIHKVRYLFDKYNDVYILASGGEKASDFDRTIIMDEFLSHRYIVRDIQDLLYKMKEQIKSVEEKDANPT